MRDARNHPLRPPGTACPANHWKRGFFAGNRLHPLPCESLFPVGPRGAARLWPGEDNSFTTSNGLELFYILLVFLVVARLFGEVAVRLGQPVLVGELIAGIVLGLVAGNAPDRFPVLSGLEHNEVFSAIVELATFFLMLLAGLELRPNDLFKDLDRSAAVATGGMLVPLAIGIGLGWWILPESDLRFSQMMFLGVALAITAVPVAVKALMDVNALDSRVGRTIVASAVIDDILSLVLLAVFTAVLETGTTPGAMDFLRIGGSSLLFIGIAYLVGRYGLRWLGRQARKLRLEQLEFTFVLVSGLALAVLAELLGLHFILGAFAAGLFFRPETMSSKAYKSVLDKVEAVNTGFLAPIFFASIGMHLDLSAVVETPWIVVAILVAATIGKLIGAGVPARMRGASMRESAAIGIGMNARGAVELIIAGIALDAGLFLQPEPIPPVIANLFSAVVITAIVTTLTTGLLLKRFMAGSGSGEDT